MKTKKILEKFNDAMREKCVRLHGVVLMQKKQVVGELYNSPYTSESQNRMYSATKSVVAIAIGKLIKDNLLSLDEKVVDIFSNRISTKNTHPNVKELTVREMLTMTTAYSSPTYTANDKNWLETYFNHNSTHPSGTVWNYDSSGSYVLGAIVKQKTGKNFIDYLRPIFAEIGVSEDIYCMEGPDGEAWGPSAMIAKTTDLAKIAYLMLEKGQWNKKQLLPFDYALDAISPLVRNDDGAKNTRFDCGYGYQIWSHPNGAFAFRGLGGQLAIGFRGRDLVFACNADTAGNNSMYDDIFNAVEDIILPNFPIIDKKEYEKAQKRNIENNIFDKVCNKNIVLKPNQMGISHLRLEQKEQSKRLIYGRDNKEFAIDFSLEREVQIIFPQKYNGAKLFNREHDINYKCSVIARWLEPKKLHIKVWAEDLFVGNMSIAIAFREDGKVGVKMQKNAQFFFDDFVGFAEGNLE